MAHSEVRCANTIAAKGKCSSAQGPLVATVPAEVAANSEAASQEAPNAKAQSKVELKPDIHVPIDLVEPESKAANWLWLLLEQSGYERW